MFIMLLSMMKGTMLYAVYEYNKAFFIELFCVNKDRPQLKCNGQCKLAQMQREENEKKADDMLKQLQSETTYFFPVRSTSLPGNDFLLMPCKTKLPVYYNHLYSFLFISKPVKPPEIHLV